MTEFAVWAPLPDGVRLDLDGTEYPMRRADDGWWRADVPAGPAARYGFVVDGDLLPDPRSPRQPDGVHARSQRHALDPAGWTDAGWTGRQLAGGVLYELHVGTFTPDGTFDAGLKKNPSVRLSSKGGGWITLTPLDAQPDPPI